jgi:AhpD family alkylhydroperoxidase
MSCSAGPTDKEEAMCDLYPQATHELSRTRRELAPEPAAAFYKFSEAVFADGALPTQTKHIIAVAVANVTQCPYCIRGHTRAALRDGVSQKELMEAIWVAAEMRAGAAFAHSIIAIDEMGEAGAAADDHPHRTPGTGEQHGHSI